LALSFRRKSLFFAREFQSRNLTIAENKPASVTRGLIPLPSALLPFCCGLVVTGIGGTIQKGTQFPDEPQLSLENKDYLTPKNAQTQWHSV
jgi:hypothetical protein